MRRTDLLSEAEKEQIRMAQNKAYKYWVTFWKYMYQVVSICSYVAMIVAVCFSYYYSIVSVDLMRAVPAYLVVLLLIYVNKVNPS